MNKMKIFVSGFLIMFVLSMIGFTLPLAAAWDPSTGPVGSDVPVLISTSGNGIGVGTMTITPPNTNLNQGAVVVANAPVYTTLGQNQNLGLSINSVTDILTNAGVGPASAIGTSGDLASNTKALVWVSPTQGGTTPASDDYVLTDNSGLVLGSSTAGLATIAANGIPLSTSYSTSGSTTDVGSVAPLASTVTVGSPNYINYKLTVNSAAPSTAEVQTVTVPTTAVGSGN
jgi:hypothetical protein